MQVFYLLLLDDKWWSMCLSHSDTLYIIIDENWFQDENQYLFGSKQSFRWQAIN